MTGRLIANRFKVTAKLGEGGMGAVYRAEQQPLGRGVALKVLKPELANTPSLVKRFNAEAQAAAKLKHPNTVVLYDFGQADDGALFIAMEYVEGNSLRQLLGKGALPVDQALYITEQVCSSLADAHRHGIVHRDLKPDNVMLTKLGKKDNIVKVLDFGIAKLRDDGRVTQDPMTQAGDLLGTPQYMAPEQIRGEKIDGRADVYALGCMLFEMVTSRLPFTGGTVMGILSKHLQDDPPTPSSVRSDLPIPPEIDRLILECLQKRPDSRPPSMEILGDRIAAMRRQLGVPTPHHISTMAPRASTDGGQQSPMAYTPTAASTPAGDPAVSPGASTQLPVGGPVIAGSLHGQQATQAPRPGSMASPAPAHTPAPPGVASPAPQYPVAAASPTPAPASAYRGSRRAGSRIGLWLLLGVLALGGIGAGVYFAVFHESGSDSTSDDDDLGEDDLPVLDELDDLDKLDDLPTNFDTEPTRPILNDDTVPSDFGTKPQRQIFD
ncbi:MAG: protein kinase [Deltaproteobacteria bacterium]|nr:protein kinase [Deltaproteobacteria bacterium]